MATPSPQTNEILEMLAPMPDGEIPPGLAGLLQKRLEGSRQSLGEFESKATGRGESFREAAQQRIDSVRQGFAAYEQCLSALIEACAEANRGRLASLKTELEGHTQRLFETLDAYASFYFAWGEQQSPLVNMIRHAVESYSRGAMQTSQAQRILQEMQQHLQSPNKSTSSGEQAGEGRQ